MHIAYVQKKREVEEEVCIFVHHICNEALRHWSGHKIVHSINFANNEHADTLDARVTIPHCMHSKRFWYTHCKQCY